MRRFFRVVTVSLILIPLGAAGVAAQTFCVTLNAFCDSYQLTFDTGIVPAGTRVAYGLWDGTCDGTPDVQILGERTEKLTGFSVPSANLVGINPAFDPNTWGLHFNDTPGQFDLVVLPAGGGSPIFVVSDIFSATPGACPFNLPPDEAQSAKPPIVGSSK